MSEIKWEDPPKGGGSQRNWKSILDQLRERPGAWAVVAEDSSPSTATQIRKGMLGKCLPGEFEARTVTTGQSRATIYARFIGSTS